MVLFEQMFHYPASLSSNGIEAYEFNNFVLENFEQLYENFADPFNLWEIQLDIIDCSNMPVHDNDMVPEIWENIIAEGEY